MFGFDGEDEEYWAAYWTAKMRERMVFMYSFTPFLEEAGTLLLAAKDLWHPWSVKRSAELSKMSYDLQEHARRLRQQGLGWACNVSEFGQDPAYVLSTFSPYRYHGGEKEFTPCPEAAPYMVAAAKNLLLLLFPMFRMVGKTFWEEKHWVGWISDIIETLMEAPYCQPVPELSADAMRDIGVHGILIECNGLACTQALLEDSYASNTGTQRKKASDLSNEQLRDLASKIGVPFEVVKDVFEAEFSSWWERAQGYRDRAEIQRKLFADSLPVDPAIKEVILRAWDPGSTSHNGYPERLLYNEVTKSEMIIKTFISMFLFFDKDFGLSFWAGKPTQRLLPG